MIKITDADIEKILSDLIGVIDDEVKIHRAKVKKETLNLGLNPQEGFDNTINFIEKDPTFFRLGITGWAFLESISHTLKKHGNDGDAFGCVVLKAIFEAMQKTKSFDPEIICGIVAQELENYKIAFAQRFKEDQEKTEVKN